MKNPCHAALCTTNFCKTHIHTYVHTRYIHTYIHVYIHAYTCIATLSYIRSYRHIDITCDNYIYKVGRRLEYLPKQLMLLK